MGVNEGDLGFTGIRDVDVILEKYYLPGRL